MAVGRYLSDVLPRPSEEGAGDSAVVKGLVEKIKQKITYPPVPNSAEDVSRLFLQALTIHTWRVFLLIIFGMVAVALIANPYMAIYSFAGTRTDGTFLAFHSFAAAYGVSVSIHWAVVRRLQKRYKSSFKLEEEMETFLIRFYIQYPIYWFLYYFVVNFPMMFYFMDSSSAYFKLQHTAYSMFSADLCALLAVLTATLISLLKVSKEYPKSDEKNKEIHLMHRQLCLSSAMVYLFAPGFFIVFVILLYWG